MKKNILKGFLFHKVTLIVTGIVALGIIGISVLTKAMPAPDTVVTNLTVDKKLTTVVVTFDYKIESADFNGIHLLDVVTAKTYPVINGMVLLDGTIQFDSVMPLTPETKYTFVAKVGALLYNRISNLNEVKYDFTTAAAEEICIITRMINKTNPIYSTAFGNLKYDGMSKLTSERGDLVFSLDQKTWEPGIDLNKATTTTTVYVMDKTKNILDLDVTFDAKALTVKFDTTEPKNIDIALSKATPTYAFDEKAILVYDGALGIKGEGLEISIDGGKTRVGDYKAEVYPTTLSIRSKVTMKVTELNKVAVDPRAGTLSFSLANEACVPDADKDGIEDALDMCADTKTSDSMAELSPNSFMVQGLIWVTNTGSKSKPAIQAATFTMTETFGCSCEQILAGNPGSNEGEMKFGCSKGTIDNFIVNRGRAKK